MRSVPFLLAVVLALGACKSDEPLYEGRALTFWTFSLESAQPGERKKACEAVSAMGPMAADKAVPRLVKLLADRDEDVQEAAVQALAKMGPTAIPAVEPLLEASDLLTRLRAADALVRLDARHAKAVSSLMMAFSGVGNAALAERARRTVVAIGAPLVPAVAKLLEDAYIPVQVLAIETLGNIGAPAQSVVPAVAQQLENERPAVRVAVLKSLARIGPKEAVVPTLQTGLADKDPEVAATARDMLAYFAEPAADAPKK
jgi:HEAT repeat protein